jgi:hypothetical protein
LLLPVAAAVAVQAPKVQVVMPVQVPAAQVECVQVAFYLVQVHIQ